MQKHRKQQTAQKKRLLLQQKKKSRRLYGDLQVSLSGQHLQPEYHSL